MHDPIQASKVKRIVELFANSPLTLKSLIDTLDWQGIVYTNDQPERTNSTLHRLLHNRSCIGEVWYQGVWHPGTFERLVHRETFQVVNDKFGTNFKIYREAKITYTGGLIMCADCGRMVAVRRNTKRHRKAPSENTAITAARECRRKVIPRFA